MSKIRIANGPYRGREKSLGEKSLTIGRDAEAGIQILDRSASRFHCEIFPVGGMWFVRDLESKNGTYVNDERLQDEDLLRPGDVIKIGTTELVFEIGSALADEDSSGRISYNDDPEMLSNTLEFRVDELSDISEPNEQQPAADQAKGMRILYQVGRILSDPTEGIDKESKVLDTLVASMPAECALLFRRDAASGKLVPAVVRTSAAHVQPVISRSIIKKTFSENKAIHSANALEDERFNRNQSIHAKGIRSVVCVPLAVAGQVRGVLYLGRGLTAAPFDQFDLELVSACALQIGMHQHASEERARHRTALNQVLSALLRALEVPAGCVGAGDRCARAAAALAEAMRLAPAARERLRQAALLFHLPALCAGKPPAPAAPAAVAINQAHDLLDTVDDLEAALPLVRLAWERLDGSGPLNVPGDELDTEVRVLAVAVAFEVRTLADPAADAAGVIAVLAADPLFDAHVTRLLQSCHLDGSLYGRI